MTQTPRKSKGRRSAILDEAIQILGEYGFNGLTVQALAERCQISNAGLLYYFGTKDQLMLAVLDEFELRERAAMEPLIAKAELSRGMPDAARAAFLELLRAMVARFVKRPDSIRFLCMLQTEAAAPSHVAHQWFLERVRLSLELYERLLTEISEDPASTARFLSAQMFGLAQCWIHQGFAFDLVREWDKAADLLLPADRSA